MLVFRHVGGCRQGDAAIGRSSDGHGRRGRLLAGSRRRGPGVTASLVATSGSSFRAGGSRRAARRRLARGDTVQKMATLPPTGSCPG